MIQKGCGSLGLQPGGRKESDFHLFLSICLGGLATERVSKRFDLQVLVNATEYVRLGQEVYYILNCLTKQEASKIQDFLLLEGFPLNRQIYNSWRQQWKLMAIQVNSRRGCEHNLTHSTLGLLQKDQQQKVKYKIKKNSN